MKRYLLDTCALAWYFVRDKRMENIIEDIDYFKSDFAVSMDSVKELVYLLQYGKMQLGMDYKSIIELLIALNINIINFDMDSLNILSSLPAYKNHTDPTDRHIIATAIAKKRILISGDEKFGQYVKDGLVFLEI